MKKITNLKKKKKHRDCWDALYIYIYIYIKNDYNYVIYY